MGRIGGGRIGGRIGGRGIGFGRRGFRVHRRPLFWRRGGLRFGPWGFYGPNMWAYRYSRWRYVHGYYDYAEHDMDLPQARLPPNGPNFCFVSFNAVAAPPEFNKITPAEFYKVMNDVRHAKSHASPDLCTPSLCCCLIPCVGWMFWCADFGNRSRTAETKAIGDVCKHFNLAYSDRGLTVQFVEFDDGLTKGLVFECQPVLANGAVNPSWTGPQPNLDPNTRQALVMDYNVMRGEVFGGDIPRYDDIYGKSAEHLNNQQSHFDSVMALAHAQVVANWFSALNPAMFGPLAGQGQANFNAAAAQAGANPEATLKQAADDLMAYQRDFPEHVNVTQVTQTNQPNMAQNLLKETQEHFLSTCALPPPPPYTPSAPSAPSFGTEAKAPQNAPYVYQPQPPQYSAPSAPQANAAFSAPLLGDQPAYNSYQS